MLGSFTFILHTHLPYVLHHGKWPHGSDWLSEAVAECYLPIIATLESLSAEGLSPRISMDFSPINLEQLADPAFKDVFLDYCNEKIAAAIADHAYFEQNNEKHFQPMAIFWKDFYESRKRQFMEYDFDVVGAFRRLSDAGILDAMTCGATHGYFPLLLRDDNIRAQIKSAIAIHEKHFGMRPRGIWLPECGYRPRYNRSNRSYWSPPVGPEIYRNQSEDRAGIEELVSEAGLEYFVVEGALTQGATVVNSDRPKKRKSSKPEKSRSLADIYWVNSSGQDLPGIEPAIFSRDPGSSSKVWDAEKGYPGAGVYLDFSKKHQNSGLRYWRVTAVGVDIGDKKQYDHEATEKQLDIDAKDFVSIIRRDLSAHKKDQKTPGVIAEPFDTELFGHWWFEGPRFLEKVLRLLMAEQPGDTSEDDKNAIILTNCSEALDNYNAPRTTLSLPEGSWGFNGDHSVWTNGDVAWMWDVIYPLEDKFLGLLKKLKSSNALDEGDLLRSIVEQAARELLLLEASDWEFVITTKGAIEYSTMRFNRHAELLTRLIAMAEKYDANEGLNEEEAETLQEALILDRPFAEIDFGWWDAPVE